MPNFVEDIDVKLETTIIVSESTNENTVYSDIIKHMKGGHKISVFLPRLVTFACLQPIFRALSRINNEARAKVSLQPIDASSDCIMNIIYEDGYPLCGLTPQEYTDTLFGK